MNKEKNVDAMFDKCPVCDSKYWVVNESYESSDGHLAVYNCKCQDCKTEWDTTNDIYNKKTMANI